MVSSASINMKQLLDNMIFYSQCSTCIFKVKKSHSLRNSDNVCCPDIEKLGMELNFLLWNTVHETSFTPHPPPTLKHDILSTNTSKKFPVGT